VAPLPGTSGVEQIEVRDYDRLPANEHRGAIDAVTWHEGWRIWEVGRGGGGADHPLVIDPWKTRKRDTAANPPVTTGAYVWIRRQSLDELPAGGGVRPGSEYEIIDLIAEHGAEWTPLALTITPFGDVVYLLLSNHTSDLNVEPMGRRWRICRPGWWQLETRLPAINYDGWGTLPDWSSTHHNYYGDLVNSATGSGNQNWVDISARKSAIKMTCNEHWLYLANFPARATDTHDLRLGSPNELNFIEAKFSTELGFKPDGTDLGADLYNTGWEAFGFPALHQKQNVFFEWSIDLYSGDVRLPWRTQYQNAGLSYAPHSIYGAWNNWIPSDTDDYDIDNESYDAPHQNRVACASTDTLPKVIGSTPTPAFH